jgi:hypothetical protein
MPSPLDTIRLKTTRAEKHFQEFKRMLGFGPDPLTPPKVTGIHLESDWTLHITTSDPTEPSPDVGLAFGDAIHQLRSSLDHLICALAMRNHSPDVCEKFGLQFPIMKDLRDFCAYRLVSQGTLRCLIGSSEFKVVEDAQPYKRNAIEPTKDPLYVLSKLDNIDKHRLVIKFEHRVSGDFSITSKSGPTVDFTVHKQHVKDQTQPLNLGGVAYPPSPFKVDVKRFEPLVVLPEEDLNVFAVFRPIKTRVNEIIDSFDPFFP